jgi:hypothetical protein
MIAVPFRTVAMSSCSDILQFEYIPVKQFSFTQSNSPHLNSQVFRNIRNV